MSWQAVTWVLEVSEAVSYSRLVLLSIASHANPNGENAFPSLDMIAREALISRREVVYCIQELEEKGELTVKRGIGRGNPNNYSLPQVRPWLEKVRAIGGKYASKKVQDMHHLEEIKGANSNVKGANQHTKGANRHTKSMLNAVESLEYKTERLEPSKAITVSPDSSILSIPEPSKSKAQIQAEVHRQLQAMREKGYIQ